MSSISIATSSGTWMRMICRIARSSACMSIKRLCTRSSHRSHVAVPSPSGDFLVGTTILRVGRGTGPV